MSNPSNPLPMTTDSVDAARTLRLGIDEFNAWDRDAMTHIDAAIKADPAFTVAWASKGLILHGVRNNRFEPTIGECLAAAQANQSPITAGERTYVDALHALHQGKTSAGILLLETHLQHYPTDLFAHRFIQQELFWMGEFNWMRAVAERAQGAWTGNEHDYAGFLSVLAFSLEESGDSEAADRFGREAVERNPSDCWGAHAVAHVLEMQGKSEEGVRWLKALKDNWSNANQISHHLWWHLCLFLIERGERDGILDILDKHIRNPESPLVQAMPDAYIDIQNVASLLLRLELRGVDVAGRWATIADVCVQRIDNHASPFTSAHAAMVLAGAGRMDDADNLIASMSAFGRDSAHGLAPRMRAAAVPAAEASVAYFKKDYEAIIQALMPVRRQLWQMGGSHAQRDIFSQLLFVACQQCGHTDYQRILLNEMGQIGYANSEARSLYAA